MFQRFPSKILLSELCTENWVSADAMLSDFKKVKWFMAHFNSACSSSGPGSQGISSVVIVSGKLVTKECFISRVHHSGDHHILSALASESLLTLRPRLLRSSPRTVLPRLSTNWRELQRKIAEWCVLWWLPRITNRFLLPRCVCVCVCHCVQVWTSGYLHKCMQLLYWRTDLACTVNVMSSRKVFALSIALCVCVCVCLFGCL